MRINLSAEVVYRAIKSIKPCVSLLVAVLFLAIVDAAWCFSGHWVIAPLGIVVPVLVAVGLYSLLLVPKYRRDKRTRIALVSSALFVLFTLVAEIFSYLVVSTNAPLVDRWLTEWDQMLNFDWPAVFLWTKHRPFADAVLAIAYQSIMPQICVVILYLAFLGLHRRLSEFNGVLVVAFLITVIASGFFPAAGPFKYYAGIVHADISPLTQFEPLRSGALRIIDLRNAQGLISMPSFHAVLAILLTYAMRKTRLFLPFLILNTVVIVSTPTRGGHYLVDVFAGAITVVLAMVLWNRHSVARIAKFWLQGDSKVTQPSSTSNV